MCAKCSVWPASWKSARQSSTPPIGWITSTTRSGTSIGAQNARGDFFSRCSTSSSTFACAWRSMPRSASVASSAGSILSRRERLVPLRRAEEPRDVPALGLVERDAEARAEERVARLLAQRSVSARKARHCSASSSSWKPKRSVQLAVVRRAERRARRASATCGRLELERVQVLLGELVARVLERAAASSRSGSFAIVGRSIRNRISSPSTVAFSVASSSAPSAPRALREVAEVPAAREVPELAHAPVAVDGRAERGSPSRARSARGSARRSARARASSLCPAKWR